TSERGWTAVRTGQDRAGHEECGVQARPPMRQGAGGVEFRDVSKASVVEIRSASPSRSPVGGYWSAVTRAGWFVGLRRRRFVACLLLVLSVVAAVAEAQAADLTVRLRDNNDNPINVAMVCLAQGSPLSGRQMTDNQGVTTFLLPSWGLNCGMIPWKNMGCED